MEPLGKGCMLLASKLLPPLAAEDHKAQRD